MSQHAKSDPFNPDPARPRTRRRTPAAPRQPDARRAPRTSSGGGSTSPTNAPRPPSTGTWRRTARGEERDILLALAEAEGRHEAHWLQLLGDHAGRPRPASLRSQFLGFLARHFGSVFVLALAQRAESRSPYATDPSATPAMVADEQIHEEVVRGLATRGRNRLAGTFRAAVFGANDGLVSNLSLVMGMAASGVGSSVVLLSGVAGLLAGALSMGAGEFISVRSQRELLAATRPTQITLAAAPLAGHRTQRTPAGLPGPRHVPGGRRAPRRGADGPAGLRLRSQPLPAAGSCRKTRGRARGRRHRLGRGGVELLLLRLRRHRADPAVRPGHDRPRGARGVRRPGGPGAAAHRRRRRACSPAPPPPPAASASWPSAWARPA